MFHRYFGNFIIPAPGNYSAQWIFKPDGTPRTRKVAKQMTDKTHGMIFVVFPGRDDPTGIGCCSATKNPQKNFLTEQKALLPGLYGPYIPLRGTTTYSQVLALSY